MRVRASIPVVNRPEVVNYHTLSDFRIEHRAALDELFTQVLAVLSAEGLVALPGTLMSKSCRPGGTFAHGNCGICSLLRVKTTSNNLEGEAFLLSSSPRHRVSGR
ncbi:MAG: hypothetical protein ACR2JB_03475 [Bryobacteraceae bacterium]